MVMIFAQVMWLSFLCMWGSGCRIRRPVSRSGGLNHVWNGPYEDYVSR